MIEREIDRVVDLTDPAANRILNMPVEEARGLLAGGLPEAAASIDGSFALVAREGRAVRLARSLDRPLRYFLAKRQDGPALSRPTASTRSRPGFGAKGWPASSIRATRAWCPLTTC